MGHHYVPRFYLRNFTFNTNQPTDKPRIFSMTEKGMIPYEPNTVGSICQKKNYNSPEQECEQKQLEDRYAGILSNFIETMDQKVYDFSNEVIEADQEVYDFPDEVIEFVSFMIGNNIFARKKLVQVYNIETIMQNGVELDNKIVMDRGYKGKYDWSKSFSGCVYKEFQNWKWGTVRLDPDSRERFITSDNPVSIFNPENVYTPIDLRLKHDESKTKVSISNTPKDRIDIEIGVTLENVSFGQDVVLTFSITPRLCLIGFSCKAREYSFKEASKNRLIEFVNLMTFGQCNKAAYSHSKILLTETRANLLSFRGYCDENDFIPSFEIGFR